MSKILPIILAVAGLGAGVGAGKMLQKPPQIALSPCGDGEEIMVKSLPDKEKEPEVDASNYEYVKLNNQFVVPDLDNGKVISMVVISLSLEVETGSREAIYSMEPRLRNALLQVLFDHANSGGFKGTFTDTDRIMKLETALRETAQSLIGADVHNVLVGDIVRQDV